MIAPVDTVVLGVEVHGLPHVRLGHEVRVGSLGLGLDDRVKNEERGVNVLHSQFAFAMHEYRHESIH